MALDSLDWFIQLTEKGNFTKAAESLCISQQTLSARLAALERELGARLVLRSTPLSLTPAGSAFLAYAKESEESRMRMMRKVDEASEGGTGVLKVAIGNMRAQALMPLAIKEFHKSFPNIRFELIEGTNDELLQMGARGQVDLVVARFDSSHPGLLCQPLYKEEVVVAIDPNLLESALNMPAGKAAELIEAEGIQLLKDCPFLLEDDADLAGRIAASLMKKAGIKTDGLIRCESMSILLALCNQGLGAVFCPGSMLDHSKNLNEQLVRIHLGEEASYQISVGRPSEAEPWTPAQTFEDVLGALFGA